MNRIPALSIILSSCAILAGCVGPSIKTQQVVRFPGQTDTVEDPEKARIVVLREPGDVAFVYVVKDGSKRIGRTAPGGYICWERPPGEAILASQMDDAVDTITLHADKNTIYYFKQELGHQRGLHAQLTALTPQVGTKLLRKCRPPIANTELARAIKSSGPAALDLSAYQTVTVCPFKVEVPNRSPDIGSEFADEIHEVLKNSFGPLFREVRFGSPIGATNEVLLTGSIKAYNAGSRAARVLMAGLGSANFVAEVNFSDATSQKILFSSDLHKLWAWGGTAGVVKGINDMMSESAVAIAATAAQAKGWRPK